MIPQTLGALAIFLLLVPPGVLLELLRIRRRGTSEETESAFREASRVALGSLGFSLVAMLLLLGIQKAGVLILRWNYYIDIEEFAQRGAAYAQQHVFLLMSTAIGELVIALLLVLGFDVMRAKREPLLPHWRTRVRSAWVQAFRVDRPTGAQIWVNVVLDDGTSFYGFIRSYTASVELDGREMILASPHQVGAEVLHGADAGAVEALAAEPWDQVVIPGSRIRYIRVKYIEPDTTLQTERNDEPVSISSDGDDDGKVKESTDPS